MQLKPLSGKAARCVALADDVPLNIWEGSVRSSKTIGSLVKWMHYVRNAPPGELLMTGKTERTVKRNLIDPLTGMLGARRCRYTAGTGELHLLGRRIYVVGGNDETAQEKIRGLTLAGAYLDEITTLPESYFVMARTRLSVAGAQLFGTTNPDGPAHWLHRNWLQRARIHVTGEGELLRNDAADAIRLARFSFRLADNPHLPAGYVEDLRRDYTGMWRSRLIDGLWVAAEGACYPMLDEQVHCAAALPLADWHGRYVTGWLGLDYGTSNPTHGVLVVLDRGTETQLPRLHAVAEWRHDGRQGMQLTDAQISARLAEWVTPLAGALPTAPIVALDPSAASMRAQMRAEGWPGLRAADNRVLDGIRTVATMVASGRLVIDRWACPVLWEELCSYRWDPKATARGVDEPLKVDDHSCDAIRYGTMAARRVWRPWLPTLAETVEQLPDAA